MRNKLPKIMNDNESGIVNLDKNSGYGTHWVAYVRKGSNILYFDSYGNLKPAIEIIKYFYSNGPVNVLYNFNRYQNYDSFRCGHLCLEFIYKNTTL